ncbi:hypothetical protein IW150_002357, partial [Coemansia sp. RSA 2607]
MAPAKRKAKAPQKPQDGMSGTDAASAAVAALIRRHNETPAQRQESITSILQTYIQGSGFSPTSIQALERAQYHEQYLWPTFLLHHPTGASPELLVSLLVLLNAKHLQRVLHSAWRVMGEHAGRLVTAAVELLDQTLGCAPQTPGVLGGRAPDGGTWVRTVCVHFLDACFGSLEHAAVRSACLPLVGIGLWTHVEAQQRVQSEYAGTPGLRRLAKHAARRTQAGKHADADAAASNRRARDLVWRLVCDLVALLWMPGRDEPLRDAAALAYACSLLSLFVTLVSQLATRRFVALLLRDAHVVELCVRAPWYRREDARAQAFRQMVDRLQCV